MEIFLYLSLPGSKEFNIYEPSQDEDALEFTFSPFSKKQSFIQLKLRKVNGNNQKVQPREAPVNFESKSHDQYIQLLTDTINEINTHNLGKIVISRAESFTNRDGKEPYDVFKKLAETYPSACVYLFQHPDAGVWMGATPELLVKGGNGILETMSLAGTREVGNEGSFEDKEVLEQSLVTDYIMHRLEELRGIKDVSLEDRQKLKAGNLYHFLNRIEASYDADFDLAEFLKVFHPTPAVGGFPKQQAIDFINGNEGYSREYYTGYFGLKDKNSFHYFVNLRCMQWFDSIMLLYAGGGITSDSDPEKEWEETKAKMRTLLNVLQLEDK